MPTRRWQREIDHARPWRVRCLTCLASTVVAADPKGAVTGTNRYAREWQVKHDRWHPGMPWHYETAPEPQHA